jgi:hypothetical protein
MLNVSSHPDDASSSKRLIATDEATPTAAEMSLPPPEFIRNFS